MDDGFEEEVALIGAEARDPRRARPLLRASFTHARGADDSAHVVRLHGLGLASDTG